MSAKHQERALALRIVCLFALIIGGAAAPSDARAADTFSLGIGNGVAGGTGVAVPLHATHDSAMQGFSVAVSFDPIPIDATGVDFAGTAVETILSGAQPQYLGVETDNVAGTLTAGVIFGFSPVPPLNQLPQLPASPDTPVHLLNILFDVGNTVLPGSVPLLLETNVGSNPGVQSVYSTDGESVSPSLSDGELVVNNLVTFTIDSREVVPGGTLTVELVCDHPEDTVVGFQVAITYDSAKLTFVPAPTAQQYWQWTDLGAALGLQGEGVEVFEVTTLAANPVPGQGFVSIQAQFDFLPPLNGQALSPISGPHSLIRLQFNVANNIGLIGQTTAIEFTEGISPANPGGAPLPPTPNIIINEDAQGIPPIVNNGQITFVSPPSFRRGDSNFDGTVNLADAIYLLTYLFSGGPSPQCFDVADVNDDGGLDVSDGVALLGYLFIDTTPPQHPFPGCGVDTTPSPLPGWLSCESVGSSGGCP
ncbi:MAG: dockerin type I repeat-containing protein [Planctomycetota bacterium]